MQKLLIAPDKFKGTLTASEAAQAIAIGWRGQRPQDSLDLLPISDGGDGFGEVMGDVVNARSKTLQTLDAAHRPCLTKWWWEPKTKTAIIESATVIGLANLPPKRFHPFELDSFGLGDVIRAAAAHGARRCILGIGGSATNDGGFGLARALGWQCLDRDGNPIERWTDLPQVTRIRAPERRRWFRDVVVAVDVRNPLLGPRGATRIYGPQKGVRPEDFEPAERCLGRLAHVVKKDFAHDYAGQPGAGAAGGLGFGLLAFLGARLEPGFDLFAHHAALSRHLRSADLVITGEGAIDNSTLMGKGVGQIAERCRKLKLPCIGLAGVVKAKATGRPLFAQTHALTDLTTIEQAKARPAFWLERLAEKAASVYQATLS